MAAKYPDKGASTLHPLAHRFKPKAYLLQASILQASSSLQFGACHVAFAMGGGVWLLDKKLQVPPSL